MEVNNTNSSQTSNDISSVFANEHGELTKYVMPIFMTIGFAGNSLSFITMLKKEWRKKSTSVYMATLAVTDTLTMLALFNENYLSGRDKKTIPGLFSLCNWHILLYGGSLTSSSWLLVGVTTDRVIAVFAPLKSRIILTPKRAAIVVVSLLLACYGLYAYALFSFEAVQLSKVCPIKLAYINWYTTGGLFMLFSIVYGYLPALIIVVLNLAIVIQLKRRQLVKSSTAGTSVQSTIRKTTVMVIVISTAFVILVGPFSIATVLTANLGVQYGPTLEIHYLVLQVLELLAFVNHAVNFLLYVGCSDQFRKTQLEMVRMLCACRRQELVDHTTDATDTTSTY